MNGLRLSRLNCARSLCSRVHARLFPHGLIYDAYLDGTTKYGFGPNYSDDRGPCEVFGGSQSKRVEVMDQ